MGLIANYLAEKKEVEDDEDDRKEVQMTADYKTSKSGRKYRAHKIVFNKGEDDGKRSLGEGSEMSDEDKAKKEKYVKGMKKKFSSFVAKYGKDAERVMHATATKMAMKEEVEEIEEGADPEVAATYKKIATQHLKDIMAKNASNSSKIYAKKMHQRALEASKMSNHTDALNHYRGVKEEVEQVDEAVTVDKKNYSWGKMVTVHHGSENSYPLHPEHQEAIKKLKDGEHTTFKDETNRKVTAHREGDKVHLSGAGSNKKTTVAHSHFTEEVEQVDELNRKTLASYVSKAAGSYGRDKQLIGRTSSDGTVKNADPDLKRAVKNRLTGINRAAERLAKEEAEQVVTEMDKSAPQPGRDGKISHSTYGSRDKESSDYFKGKEVPVKPITVKKMEKDALDVLKKQGVAEGKKSDRYHIVGKDGKPANLASYADKASAIKDRDEKYPNADVHQVGPRGKVKSMVKGVAEEIEQVDEISKELAGRYYAAANKEHIKKVGIKPNMYNRIEKDMGKKRKQGVDRAFDRMTKEEAEQQIESVVPEYDDPISRMRKKENEQKRKNQNMKEQLKGNQHKLDKNKNGKLDAHDFKLLRKEDAEQVDEGQSHQAKTTMKHVKNPTAGEKKAAKDIKPGVAGYRDRIAMLKSAEADGRLKKEEAGQVDEAWPGTPEYKKKFPDTERTTGAGAKHDIVKTATGIKAFRRFAADDEAEKPADAPKRGRGRPKKDKFAEAVDFLMSLDEAHFEELTSEGFDAFFESFVRVIESK